MARIKIDTPYRTAVAERGKFWPVDDAYLTGLGYPASGEGKYAMLTYAINDASGGGGGGFESVWIKGANAGAYEVDVNLVGPTTKAMTTTIVDAAGAQITEFGGESYETIYLKGLDDSVVSVNHLNDALNPALSSNAMSTMIVDASGAQITEFGSTPLIATISTPTPVGAGADVNLWVDEYGRQVGFGANLSLNAVDVNVINTATTMRLGPLVNLSLGVGAIGAGPTVDVSNYHNITVHIQSSGVTAGSITVQIEHSLDGINFVPISVNNIATVGDVEYSFSNQAYRYIRTNVPSYTVGYDGAIQTIIYAGN